MPKKVLGKRASSAKARTKRAIKNDVTKSAPLTPFGYVPATDDIGSSSTTLLSRTVPIAAKVAKKMTEPRARAARQKGQLNFEKELRGLLYAHGDDPDPLPETVRVLDEIVTDFIIETCHAASRHATINGRQKVKLEDFKFVVSKDERMLGRMMELMGMDKELKQARKIFNTDEGKARLERGGSGRKRKRAGKGGEKGEEGEDGGDGEDGDDDMDEIGALALMAG